MVREMNEDLWSIDRAGAMGGRGPNLPGSGSPFPAFVLLRLLIQHDSVIIKLNSFVIIFIRCIQFIEHRPAINVQFLF